MKIYKNEKDIPDINEYFPYWNYKYIKIEISDSSRYSSFNNDLLSIFKRKMGTVTKNSCRTWHADGPTGIATMTKENADFWGLSSGDIVEYEELLEHCTEYSKIPDKV